MNVSMLVLQRRVHLPGETDVSEGHIVGVTAQGKWGISWLAEHVSASPEVLSCMESVMDQCTHFL
jgi:hypothetical protein